MSRQYLKEMSDLALVSTSITQLESPPGVTPSEESSRKQEALFRLQELERRLYARMVPSKNPETADG